MTTAILQKTTRLFTPVIMAVSVYLLVRGHDAPGGGFIAALVAGAGIILRYLSDGTAGTRRLLPFDFSTLLAAGLLTAALTGLAGYAIDGHFLGGTVWKRTFPLVGEVKVASSLGFDIGVYLVVLGVVLAVIQHLGASVPDEEGHA